MNAVLKTQTTAPTLQAADSANNLILVPLPQLVPRRSKRNVRKIGPRMSIPELAASISRIGLLQNLIVVRAADGENYEVVAGDRRRAAMKLAAKQKRIAPDFEAHCLLVPDASARTVSLAENLMRESMHPADQFEAFAALVKEGRPVEDIAADFGVTPLVVQRRLRLGNVSKRLLDDYRTGAVTLEQLMALAITDDHAAQESAFYSAPEWQRDPSALRQRLTARKIAGNDPLARFAGVDAYTAAGGAVVSDLFAPDDASGTYLADPTLLDKLVREKLDALAGEVRAEGWAWVEAVPHLSYTERQAFHDAPQAQREPTRREAQRIESLRRRIDEAGAALEAAEDAGDEHKAGTLYERYERLESELAAAHDRLSTYAPQVRAVAGAIVTIDGEGEATVHRGLLREAEAKALRTLERLRQGFTGDGATQDSGAEAQQPDKPANLSDRLAQRLSAHRTAALQIEVARHPHAALAALVHGMVRTVLQDGYDGGDLPLGVRLTVQHRLEGFAPDWPGSPAAAALRDMQQAWGRKLPEGGDELFAALLAMKQRELVRLLAVCVAGSVDVVTLRATQHPPGAALAQAVELDMRAWWTPTADGYFQHVSKAAILTAVQAFAPSHAGRLAKLKKADIASEAERLAAGTGWMPAVFADDAGTAPDTSPDDADGEAEEAADALAA